jgi:hypothetical protein
MAHLNFIKAAITGRLGEIVGSSWKGINYIKTYTKPANPRTQIQQETRHTFGFISQMASAYAEPLLNRYMFPHPRRMSPMNRCVQINKRFIPLRYIPLEVLEIYPPNTGRDVLLTWGDINSETVDSEYAISWSMVNVEYFRRRPDAIAVGLYNDSFDLWYGVGVKNISTTGDIIYITIIVPQYILSDLRHAVIYYAPVWKPNPNLKLAGGNGPTNTIITGPIMNWKPSNIMHPSKKIEMLKSRISEINERVGHIDINAHQKRIKEFEASKTEKENSVVIRSNQGLEHEFERLQRAEKRLEKEKTSENIEGSENDELL